MRTALAGGARLRRPIPLGLCSRGERARLVVQARFPRQSHAAPLQPASNFSISPQVQSYSSASPAPIMSSLRDSAQSLAKGFWSHEAKLGIASEADASIDHAAVLARLKDELEVGEEELQVFALGDVLSAQGRKSVVTVTPTGPGGGPGLKKVRMVLPTVEDMSQLFESRRESKPRVAKPEDLANILEKYLKEKFYGRRNDHVGLIAAWGPKTIGDSEGEFAEVGALMALSLGAYRSALEAAKGDFQFEVNRIGDGRECLVMPPSNFALLGLKDVFHELLQGYRVLAVIQPRFFKHYREIQRDLLDCGLPEGLFETFPGITPEAEPAVLHEALRQTDRLQFTGSSTMFKGLVKKAYELGNLRLEHGGEVSGLNKVRLDGVSAAHPAAAVGAAWAAMANNGELCTSASLIEFDPATGDTAASVKTALETQTFKIGRNPEDSSLNILLKEGKSDGLEVLTEEPDSGFREWWEKKVLAIPRGASPDVRTNQSLGHCVYAPSIERAVATATKEDASCLYCVGLPEDASAFSARAGTTGCKLPESVFGGMKSYTNAVAGDHDGVGSLQTLLNTVKRRGPSWRDQDDTTAKYELTETAEDILAFLSPREQLAFPKQIFDVLEIFAAFEPDVTAPYDGQPLVGANGRSQLVTLAATRPTRKNLLIPAGVGLPEDIVKMAMLVNMSPLKELPVDLHLVNTKGLGKLRVADPLKSFLRVTEKSLGWRLHWHASSAELVAAVEGADYPPYFYCVKDRHMLPLELLVAVAEKGGYCYEGLPKDALSLYRMLTTTQAWTVACTEDQVSDATAVLRNAWQDRGLREDPHEPPELVRPTRSAEMDIGGGFGAGGLDNGAAFDDDISSDSSDSSDDETADKESVAKPAPTAKPAETPVAGSTV